jgi:hypothetical protein
MRKPPIPTFQRNLGRSVISLEKEWRAFSLSNSRSRFSVQPYIVLERPLYAKERIAASLLGLILL